MVPAIKYRLAIPTDSCLLGTTNSRWKAMFYCCSLWFITFSGRGAVNSAHCNYLCGLRRFLHKASWASLETFVRGSIFLVSWLCFTTFSSFTDKSLSLRWHGIRKFQVVHWGVCAHMCACMSSSDILHLSLNLELTGSAGLASQKAGRILFLYHYSAGITGIRLLHPDFLCGCWS